MQKQTTNPNELGVVAATQRTPTNHGANYTSYETIEQALSFIPAHDRDIWIKCGMALKSEFGDAGFDGMGQVGCLP